MGEIRITSGKYGGRLIASPDGEGTRPLLTRLRKSLADVLRPNLPGSKILELFGGTGAISFELLSNGASRAVIIEADKTAASLIESNRLHLKAEARVVNADCFEAIKRLKGENFDLVIVAPPYGHELHIRAMEALKQSGALADEALIVVQREKKEPFYEPSAPYELIETRNYGRTIFDLYRYER